MKLLAPLLLAVAFVFVPVAEARAAVFYDGNQLNQWAGAHERASEHRASSDDFTGAAHIHGYVIATAEAFDGRLFCIPMGATAGQLVAVTRKYLREYPERWNEPASQLVIAALTAAFPCAKKR
jgi:hypothetical protein